MLGFASFSLPRALSLSLVQLIVDDQWVVIFFFVGCRVEYNGIRDILVVTHRCGSNIIL